MKQIPAKRLSHKQLSALSHIALSGSISEGARQAGVSRSSIYRWLNDPAIRRELDTLREEIADIARTKLHHMTLRALQVIESSLHDESQRARFRAAVATIDMAQRSTNNHDAARRLDWLEDAVTLQKEPRL